jgi:hypothetical protein
MVNKSEVRNEKGMWRLLVKGKAHKKFGVERGKKQIGRTRRRLEDYIERLLKKTIGKSCTRLICLRKRSGELL